MYKKQVQLLLDVLPEVAREPCFALHGGTAINFFFQDMPRLSVDIDLTYIPVEDRDISLKNISQALVRIKHQLEKIIPNIHIQHQEEVGKLLISLNKVVVKIEVNLVKRGLIQPAIKMALSKKVQSKFSVFLNMQVVSKGELYGGKICAALDRQHPRDLFDIKYLLKQEGFFDKIRYGFIFCLVGSSRPIHESLYPTLLNQEQVMKNQFEGMSEEVFSYTDFELTRKKLIQAIHKNINEKDKLFLMSINNLNPDWSIYDFQKFPSVQWKLKNLEILKNTNYAKYKKQCTLLKQKLCL